MFKSHLAAHFKSSSQKARVLSENWVHNQVFCPNCGLKKLNKYENNKPVADFFCIHCGEDFELKSSKQTFGNKIVDGAYKTMVTRLTDMRNPNFFLLNYESTRLQVINFFVIPKHFFTPGIIQKRKPLSKLAHRSGWVGCNILLNSIPQTGKIYFVRNKVIEPQETVFRNWGKTLFLRERNISKEKGWLLDLIHCIEKLNATEFSLNEIYEFRGLLKAKHPRNKNIKEKIRQQLQILRDKKYLIFLGRGKYKII